MKKTSVISLVLVVLMVLTTVAGCTGGTSGTPGSTAPVNTPAGDQPETPEAAVEPIKVAVFQSLTGSNASSASFQVQTLQLSCDYFNETNSIKSLGGAKIELVWVDNMSDINAMKTVVENAFQDKTYDFGILSGSTAYTMPAIASITKAGVPTLTKAQGDAIFEQGCNNIFCIPVTSSTQAKLPMEFLQYLKSSVDIDTNKIGILCIDNEHGISTRKTYEDLIKSMDGFNYVYSELYPADITDMSSVITAMKQAGVEILLSSSGDSDAKLLFNTMKTMNFNPLNLCSGSGVLYPSFYQDAGESIVGVLCASISNAFTTNGENSEDFLKLRQRCYEQYGHFGGDFLRLTTP